MIKQWIKSIKQARQDREYRRGFEWAMGEVYIAGADPVEVEYFVTVARDMGSYTAFDAGIERAVKLLPSETRE